MIDANEAALYKHMNEIEKQEKDYENMIEELVEDLDGMIIDCYRMFRKIHDKFNFDATKEMFLGHLEEII